MPLAQHQRIAGSTQSDDFGSLAVHAQIGSFSFDSRIILRDIQLSVQKGEAVAVLGSSGCGKSTLIRLLAGLLPSENWQFFDGKVELFGSAPPAYRSTGRLAVMFQDPTLLPHLSVEQNIGLPLQFLGRSISDDVRALARLVGLDEFRQYLPRDLSGGMRTRTALARSFVSEPSLLFMDEPFTGLDLGWRESLYASLQDLRLKYGTTVLLVTHNLEEAVYNSERILVLSPEGKFIEELQTSGSTLRDYRFGETVERHTALLSKLAQLLSAPSTKEST